MSSSSPRDAGPAPDAPSDVRPLPAWPSLEFERKQAKRLLVSLRRGDPDALARVRARQRDAAEKEPAEFQLADAQFTIAREYGFTSWPRLVEYFESLRRQVRSGARRGGDTRERHERAAERLLAQHRAGSPPAEFFGTFVPRFYGRRRDAILASEVTIEEARLVHARMHRYPSWDALLQDARPDGEPPENEWTRSASPDYRAGRAIRNADIEALDRLIDENPGLMDKVARVGHVVPISILQTALWIELEAKTPAARAVTDYLVSRGGDLRETASAMLITPFRFQTPADVEYLLARGADPEWLPPNGIPVIEHAICRYWNGAAVDVIARRVTPRPALWVAAGLGDVEAVKRYIGRDGAPNDRARHHRPDFTALMIGPTPYHPEADDQTIVWEAFFVAALNQRYAVLDLLLDRGFPIDYMAWGESMLHLAVGNRWIDLVEFLVRRGANVDLQGWHPNTSARQAAESIYGSQPNDPSLRRLLELCGGRDAETVAREAAEARAKETRPSNVFLEALTRAKQDALHTGKVSAGLENLLVGLLRGENTLAATFLSVGGIDLQRLRAHLEKRLTPSDEDVGDFPFDDRASQACMDAQAEAKERFRTQITPLHLLFVLLKRDDGPVAEMIHAVGGDLAKVRSAVEGGL